MSPTSKICRKHLHVTIMKLALNFEVRSIILNGRYEAFLNDFKLNNFHQNHFRNRI